MRILLIGGTGLISSELSRLALTEGHDVTLVNRGRSPLPAAQGAHIIHADASDAEALRAALRGPRLRGEKFDAVVQFIAFEPEQVLADLETFRRLTDRYVLIATAAAYRKFDRLRPLTEDVPLENEYWEYARKKIACEEALRTSGAIPWTIVRPAHTYGDSKIPGFTAVSRHPWTLVDRMRRGADIILPGDGTSLWTITHASDVAAGILGLAQAPDAVGRAVHVTGSEALTWRAIHEAIGAAAGVEADALREQFVCVPSDALVAAAPSQRGSIYGDKMHPAVYDTSLLRSLVPGWEARIPFAEGVADAIAFFEANEHLRTIDEDANTMFDALGARYRAALRD